MATGDRDDPYRSFNFIVDFEGIRAGFTEVSGISGETGVVEYREGSDTGVIRKLPGLTKYDAIVLKNGYTENGTDLWLWRKTVIDGETERRNGTISLLTEDRQVAFVWQITAAWPSKWGGPALNATENKVAIQETTLQHEGIRLET
jgi:phage tail-like protein